MKRTIFIILAVLLTGRPAYPIEGMWIPLLLDSLNIIDMQEKGLKLSAEDIYSINQASLKDAVVVFGGGCTGEVISPEGLLITNHHCGYSRIQSHSTLGNNLLENGFWALSREEELPNPGLTVTFLVRIEDITERILEGVNPAMEEEVRNRIISANALPVVNEAIRGTHYQADIKPFYFGRQYFLFVYEVFQDVRLVGTPPESIGRFGGDSDNWAWPRHTGDFSLFRIYADKDNQPAPYAPDNVPYHPRKHLPVSVKGVSEGDFTMVIGYPGNTDEYLLSEELSMLVDQCLPAKVQMRTLKLNAMDRVMALDDGKRLGYASKYVSISNYWKKWIGITRGIRQFNATDEKALLENRFGEWASGKSAEKPLYAGIMERLEDFYTDYEPLYVANDIGTELLGSVETFGLINRTLVLASALPDTQGTDRAMNARQLVTAIRSYYRSNPVETDRETLPDFLRIYGENTSGEFHPGFYREIQERYAGDYGAYVEALFKKSLFADTVRLFRVINRSPEALLDRLLDDPVHMLYYDFNRTLTEKVYIRLDSLTSVKNRLYRIYLEGLMEMNANRLFYPDANFTMRVTYGRVEGYRPSDAIDYNWSTTMEGIFEKENPGIADYVVPQKLSDLYASKDLGTYADHGRMPVCFIASNHTSGGNSGSPVLNAEGQLIGINFDRNWEGTMSDYYYHPEICRNISLDIRYVLFIIERYAQAQALLDEMTIIK